MLHAMPCHELCAVPVLCSPEHTVLDPMDVDPAANLENVPPTNNGPDGQQPAAG